MFNAMLSPRIKSPNLHKFLLLTHIEASKLILVSK